MRTDDKDDGSLFCPRDFPSSPAPDLAEEEVDNDPPHARDDVVDHVAAESATSVEEHGDLVNDETSDGAQRGGDEEPEAANRVGDDDEEALEEGAEVRVGLG